MNSTSKPTSTSSHENVLRSVHNADTATLSVGGFVAGKVGHKIEQAIATTTIADDTVVLTYKDGAVTLMVLTVIYTDGTRAELLSVERTA